MTKRTKRNSKRKPASTRAKAARASRRKDPNVKIEHPQAADPGDAKLDRADKILRHESRRERWQSACNTAIVARMDLDEAIQTLSDLRDEFVTWRDNLPENFASSALGEKLDAVCDLEIDRDAVLDPLDFLDAADGMDLPLGYGRD